MNQQTEVERAAGLYQTALNDRRGRECSESTFHAAVGQACEDVEKLLILEDIAPDRAKALAEAGKLLQRAKQRGHVR